MRLVWQSQLNLVLNTLQVSSCIPVSAEEVISYILHKNPHRHLDQESDDEAVAERRGSRAKNARSPESPPDGRDTDAVGGRRRASPSPQRMAEQAAMRSLRGHRQYIILDCRHKDEFEACRLAPALHLDPELLISPDDLDAKLKEFMPLQASNAFFVRATWWGVLLRWRDDDDGLSHTSHWESTLDVERPLLIWFTLVYNVPFRLHWLFVIRCLPYDIVYDVVDIFQGFDDCLLSRRRVDSTTLVELRRVTPPTDSYTPSITATFRSHDAVASETLS